MNLEEWVENNQDNIYQMIAEVCDELLGNEFIYHFVMWDKEPRLISKDMNTAYNDAYCAFQDMVYQEIYTYFGGYDGDEGEPTEQHIKEVAREYIEENTVDVYDKKELFIERLEQEFESRCPAHLNLPYTYPDEDTSTLYVIRSTEGWLKLFEYGDLNIDYMWTPDEFINRIPDHYFDEEWIQQNRDDVAAGILYLPHREEL